ncbi:MAG TPA: DUF4349 domain-containing protein, partial [Terriglobales bacterium]|nr:DUF4349 domain-containing protein [Terriglobales bacterium]
GGYVHESSIDSDKAAFELRIPAQRLDAVLDQLARLGQEKSRELSTEDVTDKLIDLEAEIANKEALRDRLRALLARSNDVKDVLSVEHELTRVQTELDSLKGRLKTTTQDVAFSSVKPTLTAPAPEKPTRILGPLGYLFVGSKWLVTKLFVIRSGE